MEKKAVPPRHRPDYRKWLRYFLDFREKYSPPESRSDQVRLFIEKLKSKGQTQQQLVQAAATPIRRINRPDISASSSSRISQAVKTSHAAASGGKRSSRSGRRFDELWFRRKTNSREWDNLIEKLEAEIKTRHYSRKTLIAYAEWTRKFQIYLKDKAVILSGSGSFRKQHLPGSGGRANCGGTTCMKRTCRRRFTGRFGRPG